jgi:hypothetical protein
MANVWDEERPAELDFWQKACFVKGGVPVMVESYVSPIGAALQPRGER